MAFAFQASDMVLARIDEDNDDDSSADEGFTKVSASMAEESLSEAKAAWETTKLRTATLKEAVSEDISELSDLLEKLNTDAATRNEKERIHALHSKLDDLKDEIVDTKHRESTAEKAVLDAETTVKTLALRTAVKEKAVSSMIRNVCSAESVDVAFVLDCTGSMSSYIAAVKNSIREIVDRIQKTNGDLKLRLAMVAYRDIGDGSERFEVLDFCSSVDTFKAFVGKLTATGGDDAPEDMAGAVQKANALDWKYSTRVVFLIADAPCHGRQFHSLFDSYPSGTPGIDIVKELKSLLAMTGSGTMTVNFGRITGTTDAMINRFADLGINMDVMSIHDTAKVSAGVTKSVRKSIFKTMTLTTDGTKSAASFGSLSKDRRAAAVSLKAYKVTPTDTSTRKWRRQPVVAVKVFRNRSIESFDDLRASIGIGVIQVRQTRRGSTTTMYMRRATEPFAEGELRIAYHAQLSRKKGDFGGASKNGVVVKSFKHIGKGLNDRGQYFKQMEVSTIAHFLAEEYNRSKYRPAHCALVRVLQVCVVEEEDETNEIHGHRRFSSEERLPEGAFVKFNNNTGQWDEDYIDESLLRFSDYTYQMTRGYLMVADLQGVKKGNEFVLTDPVILCKDLLRFGSTNLGGKFMEKCISSTRAYMKEKCYT